MTAMAFARKDDADLLATRRAWMALEGWHLVRTFIATRGDAVHTVYRREDEWRCTCADFQYTERKRGGACKHIVELGGKGTGKPATPPERPAPAVSYNPEVGDDLTELLAASREAVMWVPECWDFLLDGEMPTPSKKGPARSPDDPAPCRNDFRKWIGRIRGYEIEAQLRSGSSNYWIEWLFKQNGRLIYKGTADGRANELDFGVPEKLELPLPDGGTFEVEVRRYRTERPGKRRRRW